MHATLSLTPAGRSASGRLGLVGEYRRLPRYGRRTGPRGRTQWRQVNVRALVAIALIVLWGAALVATGVFDPAGQTPPSQFDYDGGSLPPTASDRAVATVQAAALIATLPVAVLALCIAASSLRVWREQVSAIIATSVASLSTLVSIGLAWIGVGTLIFFT